MSVEEIQAHNEKMIAEATAKHKRILEWDGDIIVGYGSDADYDTHAYEVQEGLGYYDDDGNFVRYPYDPEY